MIDATTATLEAREARLWDKPALACLSSRFPYGTPITLERAAGYRYVTLDLGGYVSSGFNL